MLACIVQGSDQSWLGGVVNQTLCLTKFIILHINTPVCIYQHIKAKQPKSGDLCDIAIQYTIRRLFCFYILLFNGFKSFQDKIYEINMYLLLYFIFFKSECRNTSHCNTKVTLATL